MRLIAALALFSVIAARTITLKNSCKESLSIAYSDRSLQGKSPDHVRLPLLAAGQSHPLDVGRKWESARIWAGSGCSGEPVQCVSGMVPPWTLAEFNLVDAQALNQPDANDDFDVSVVDGFNLPLSITYDEEKCAVPAEIPPKCDGNINAKCPQVLRTMLDPQGLNLGCYSACHAGFGDEKYGNRDCCTGAYGEDPTMCVKEGVDFYDLYKDLCPGAYAHAYDEASKTALRQCKAKNEVDYTVEFCPSNSDYKGTVSGAPDYAQNFAKATSKATTWSQTFVQTMGPPRTRPGPAPTATGGSGTPSGSGWNDGPGTGSWTGTGTATTTQVGSLILALLVSIGTIVM